MSESTRHCPSRRAWLAIAASCGLSPWISEPVWADDFEENVDLRMTGTSKSIRPSRALRLQPIEGNTRRVVVTAMALDPQGKFIAVAGDDFAIRVIDASAMQVVKTIAPVGEHHHRDTIRSLAFDPTGSKLASAGNDGRIAIYRRDSGFEPIQSIRGSTAITCVAFRPDGKQMAAVGFSDQVFLIGNAAGPMQLTCGCQDLRTVTYSGDGRWMAVGGRVGDIHLYQTRPNRKIKDIPLHDGRIQDATFRRDANTLVSVGDDGRMCVYHVAEDQKKLCLTVADGRLYSVTMLDSSLSATGGSDDKIHLVDTDSGQRVGTLEGHIGSVTSLACMGNWIFSGGFDATVQRWSIGDLLGAEPQIAGSPTREGEKSDRIER